MGPWKIRSQQAAPDLVVYRSAVLDLVAELVDRSEDVIAKTIATRLREPEFTAVLGESPHGVTGATDRLLSEVRDYTPNSRSSATDVSSLIRIFLLSQIDAAWWGQANPFHTDTELCNSPELVDLTDLRKDGHLRFRYRQQVHTFAGRVARAVERRVFPHRTPRTAGMLRTLARPEMVALLNQLAQGFARRAPGIPPMWVTSLTRSVEHQMHLRSLGYSAMLPSSHCAGYAADIEMTWFRQMGAAEALMETLFERQELGDVNVIDEGQAWHVCINPAVAPLLRQDYDNEMG